jgi:hypothetical protein
MPRRWLLLSWVSVLVAFACLAAVSPLARQRAAAPPTDAGSARAVAAAEAFLATLEPAKRSRANIDLTAKTRVVWSNLPTGIAMQVGATERNGLKLGDMTPAQEKAALALLTATLSRDGFQKVMAIVDADQVLETRSAPSRRPTDRVRFGRAEYYIAVLGRPSSAGKWMVQFGGHHLAINVTLAAGQSVLTPTHTGAQPASFSFEGKTIRPLGEENDKAFALINALSAEPRKQVILGYEVRNLVLGPGTDGKMIEPEGARASGFPASQQDMLVDLINEWVGILGDEAAAAKMMEVRATIGETYFAWAGSTTNGQPAYFRIHGPSVFIEYAPQGGANSTDHIHTIFRDPTNDYLAKVTDR